MSYTNRVIHYIMETTKNKMNFFQKCGFALKLQLYKKKIFEDVDWLACIDYDSILDLRNFTSVLKAFDVEYFNIAEMKSRIKFYYIFSTKCLEIIIIQGENNIIRNQFVAALYPSSGNRNLEIMVYMCGYGSLNSTVFNAFSAVDMKKDIVAYSKSGFDPIQEFKDEYKKIVKDYLRVITHEVFKRNEKRV